ATLRSIQLARSCTPRTRRATRSCTFASITSGGNSYPPAMSRRWAPQSASCLADGRKWWHCGAAGWYAVAARRPASVYTGDRSHADTCATLGQGVDGMISRRRFLITSAVGFGGSLLAISSAAAADRVAAGPAYAVPSNIADVPRNRTLIMAGLGGEHFGGFTDLGNFNSFSPTISRSGWTQAGTEDLFYFNMLGDDFIPWLAEGYQYNA